MMIEAAEDGKTEDLQEKNVAAGEKLLPHHSTMEQRYSFQYSAK